MQKHGAMHEPTTSYNSNGVSITREQLLFSTPADAGREPEVISGIKTNYHSCKGLRKRGHRLNNARHGAWRGKRENSYERLQRDRRSLDNSRRAGSARRALIILVNECAIPALRAFSYSMDDRKAANIHCSRFEADHRRQYLNDGDL